MLIVLETAQKQTGWRLLSRDFVAKLTWNRTMFGMGGLGKTDIY